MLPLIPIAPPSPVSVPEKFPLKVPPVMFTVGPPFDGNEVTLIQIAPPPKPCVLLQLKSVSVMCTTKGPANSSSRISKAPVDGVSETGELLEKTLFIIVTSLALSSLSILTALIVGLLSNIQFSIRVLIISVNKIAFALYPMKLKFLIFQLVRPSTRIQDAAAAKFVIIEPCPSIITLLILAFIN